jgi:hypothetical protein
MRLAVVLVAVALALAGCGNGTDRESASAEAPDASQLVVQLSDLPAGYDLIPAESFAVSTAKVLRQPGLAKASELIRRERLSGYQNSFVSPTQTRLECNTAVYRSPAAASEVYRVQTLAGTRAGRFGFPPIGEESRPTWFLLGDVRYYAVTWRFRTVLAGCVTGRWFEGSPKMDLRTVAQAQQRRIAGVLGGR